MKILISFISGYIIFMLIELLWITITPTFEWWLYQLGGICVLLLIFITMLIYKKNGSNKKKYRSLD